MRRFVVLAVSAALLVPGSQVVLPAGAAASVDGTYSVLAGGGVGDGLPATSVYLPAVAAGTDAAGATYLADTAHARVRRVDPGSGVVSTVAGVGEASGLGQGYAGDGGPATAAQLSGLNALAVTAAGDVYVATNSGAFIRRVDHATATITRVAGAGGSWGPPVPTSDAKTSPMQVMGLAVDDGTGDVYLADNSNTVWVLHPDGSLAKVAGNGASGNTGDGGPAVDATLDVPWTVAVLPDHDLLIGSFYAIRRVDSATGIITTVAGSANNGPDLVDGGTPLSGSIAHAANHIVVTPNPAVAGGSVVYFQDGGSTRWFNLGPNGGTSQVHTLALPFACWPAAAAPAATLLLRCTWDDTYRYDPATGELIRVAGLGPDAATVDQPVDGAPAAQAPFAPFEGVALVAGETYVSTTAGFVYRIGDDGLVHQFAGRQSAYASSVPADGTALTSASLAPFALAHAPSGGLYIADCPWPVKPACAVLLAHDGVLDRYAGADTAHPFTDGMPASDFSLPTTPPALAALPNGDLFIAPPAGPIYVVRAADHTVHRVPFDPASLWAVAGYATAAPGISGIATAPDGSLVVATDGRIVRVDPDTGAATVIGTVQMSGSIAALTDGSVLVVDRPTAAEHGRLLRFAPDGGMTVLAREGAGYEGGALTDLRTTGRWADPLGPLAAGADGSAVVANSSVGRVQVVHPGTASPALPAVSGLRAGPGTGAGEVALTWSTAGLPAGAQVRLSWCQWPFRGSVPAFDGTTAVPATDGGVTVSLSAGHKYVISAYVVDGPDQAGTSVSPPASVTVVAPGDATPPHVPLRVQVRSLGTTANLGWLVRDTDLARTTIRLAAGSVPPGPGEGKVITTDPRPRSIFPGPTELDTATATGLTAGKTYSVSVVSTDFTGNASAPATLTFVAGSSPHLRITGLAAGGWVPPRATFHVTSDTPSRVRCRLDGFSVNCGLPGSYTVLLGTGRPHEIAFTPVTDVGEGATVRRVFRVDADRPIVTSPMLRPFTRSGTIRVPAVVAYDNSSGVASHDLRYRTVSRTGVRSVWHYPAAWQHSTYANRLNSVAPGVTACFSTRARDRVGNVSAWSPATCTTVLYDDRALAAGTAGWSRGRHTGYYAGTWTQTWRAGQRLTLSRVSGTRVALLVTEGPWCGSLRVSNADGSYVREVNLGGPTWRRSVLIRLPDAPRTGRLTIVTLYNSSRVRIDGVGVGFAH